MIKNWKSILIVIVAMCAAIDVYADDKVTQVIVENRIKVVNDSLNTDTLSEKVIGQISTSKRWENERVIVGSDTVNLIIPEKNYGRYDRGLFNFLFIPKGQWSFGLSVAYGEFNTDDVQLLSFLKNLDFKGSIFSIDPYISYFFRHNQSIGMRIGYSRNNFDLDNLSVDIDDDMNFTLSDVKYHTESYSASVFYRNYVGLDNSRRFALFNEVDLQFSNGNGTFLRKYDDKPKETNTITTQAKLNFSPGLCCFIQDNVSINVSFGIFGVYFKKESQKTDGIDEGSRTSSGASFKFNLLNLNLGVAIHI